ncbi:GNAT family N-acetyltransferase [Erwinia sp. V71]|uniref:GNAT family N-acetyltransferase n=1 Tax=Erwinia sp. V71 TaxID=3369424 RepID=UPI003F627167
MDYTRIRIDTPRLILRPFVAQDADSWFAIMSDPQVMRYWSHTAWQDRREAEQEIAGVIRAMAAGEYLKLAITAKPQDRCIGSCIFFHHHPGSQRGAIGYCLASDAQGQGYMTEALSHFFRFLQQEMSLRRLEADIHPDNLASARVLQRMGFVQEGLMRERWCVGGELSDSALFGLLLNK